MPAALTTKTVRITPGLLPTGLRPRAKISTEDVDAERDRVIQAGLSFRDNLRVTSSHDYRALPLARVTAIHRYPHHTEAEWEWFANDEAAARAKNIYEQGGLDASIGFHVQEAVPNAFGGLDYTRARVVEFALTSVPANEHAVAVAKAHGRDERVLVLADGVEVDPRDIVAAVREVVARPSRLGRGDEPIVFVLEEDAPDAEVRYLVNVEDVRAAWELALKPLVDRQVKVAIDYLRGRVD